MQHVLPEGFHKIRHVGLYGSPVKLAAARALLGMAPLGADAPLSWQQKLLELTGRDVRLCPHCATPLVTLSLPPVRVARAPPAECAA